jgi:hypothetical protein
MSSGKVSGIVTDNPRIAGQVDEEVSIKTPEQQAYADLDAANRAATIAKNKAHAAADAYEAATPENGVYGDLTERAAKLQSLSTAGRSPPVPTEEEVDAAKAEAKEAAKAADEVVEAA